MKYEKDFVDFLDYDRKQNYYYKIKYVNVIKRHNGNYYEIFIDNLNELKEDESNDYILMERYIDYLDKTIKDYNFEDYYYDTEDFVFVYDSGEYINE